MSADTTDWKDLREFKSIDVTRSFVLSWSAESGSLLIDVDLFLCPDHAFYEKPRPAEKVCFRPALLEFSCCTRAASPGSEADLPLTDMVRALSGGQISGFQRTGEGQYEIKGDFGTVVILAGRPVVRLKGMYA